MILTEKNGTNFWKKAQPSPRTLSVVRRVYRSTHRTPQVPLLDPDLGYATDCDKNFGLRGLVFIGTLRRPDCQCSYSTKREYDWV